MLQMVFYDMILAQRNAHVWQYTTQQTSRKYLGNWVNRDGRNCMKFIQHKSSKGFNNLLYMLLLVSAKNRTTIISNSNETGIKTVTANIINIKPITNVNH